MLDPLTDFGDYSVRLSQLRSDKLTRNVHLGRAHDLSRPVRCLCIQAGVNMGVAKRGSVAPSYYLYSLKREDLQFHALNCPHRQFHDDVNAEVLSSQDRRKSSLDDASFLLPRLLLAAKLNYWRPEFLQKRTYSSVRYRVIEAAKRLSKALDARLSDSLYFPPKFYSRDRDDLRFEWQVFVDQLKATDTNIPRGIIIGLLRDISPHQEQRGHILRLSEFNQTFYVEGEIPFCISNDQLHKYFCMLIVERSGNSKVRVISVAYEMVSKNFIPVLSEKYAALADDLARDGYSFSTSMVCDHATVWAVPQFIVHTRKQELSVIGLDRKQINIS